MRPRAGILLQARMGSQRLPGKALAQVGDRPIVAHCLQRLVASGAGEVVLATTDRTEDDRLAEAAARLALPSFRGSATDVLERFVQCAESRDLQHVIRATADNPGVDMLAPARVLAVLRHTGADYVYEDGLPYGAAVEGVASDALLRAAALARAPGDREHVTTFIRRRTDLFQVVRLPAPAPIARPDVRLTVDTADDLCRIRELFGMVPAALPPVGDLIDAWDRLAARSVA